MARDVHHAHDHGLDDDRRQHRLRGGPRTAAPGRAGSARRALPSMSEASGVFAPGLVVRASSRRGSSRRGCPGTARPDVGDALGQRLLVHVDPVAVLRGERARVAGRLREADQQQRDRRREDVDHVVADVGRSREGPRRRQAARDVADQLATPRSARSNNAEASSPPTTRTSAPGTRGRDEPQPEDHGQRDDARPRASSRAVSSEAAEPARRASASCSSPSASVPVSLASSPIVVSMPAPNRNPVITAFDRNCEIQPILKTASSRKKHARDEGDRRHHLTAPRRRSPPRRGRRPRRPPPAPSSARWRSAARYRTARRGWHPPPPRRGRSRSGPRRCPRSPAPWAPRAPRRRGPRPRPRAATHVRSAEPRPRIGIKRATPPGGLLALSRSVRSSLMLAVSSGHKALSTMMIVPSAKASVRAVVITSAHHSIWTESPLLIASCRPRARRSA